MANRRGVAQGVAESWGSLSPVPAGFDAIPLVNNQKSWFVSYSKHRAARGCPHACGACRQQPSTSRTTRLPNVDANSPSAYDEALRVKGVKWNLSLASSGRDPVIRHVGWAVSGFLTVAYGWSIADRWRGLPEVGRRLGQGSPRTAQPQLLPAAVLCCVGGRPARRGPALTGGLAYWAARLDESEDLDAFENDFKRDTARWPPKPASRPGLTTRRGRPHSRRHSSTNTIHYLYVDNVNKATAAARDAMLALLGWSGRTRARKAWTPSRTRCGHWSAK